MIYALVAMGGAVGALLRFLTVGWASRAFGLDFPWGTMIVNILGSFVMGLLAVMLLERFDGSWGRYAPLLMTGVLGGFTTFSAFSLDALYLMERGRIGSALAYVGGSVGLAILGLFIGLAAARAILAAAA